MSIRASAFFLVSENRIYQFSGALVLVSELRDLLDLYVFRTRQAFGLIKLPRLVLIKNYGFDRAPLYAASKTNAVRTLYRYRMRPIRKNTAPYLVSVYPLSVRTVGQCTVNQSAVYVQV